MLTMESNLSMMISFCKHMAWPTSDGKYQGVLCLNIICSLLM